MPEPVRAAAARVCTSICWAQRRGGRGAAGDDRSVAGTRPVRPQPPAGGVAFGDRAATGDRSAADPEDCGGRLRCDCASCRARTAAKPPSGSRGRSTCARRWTQLPEVQREALVLSYFGGLSQAEVATRVGSATGDDQDPDGAGHAAAGRPDGNRRVRVSDDHVIDDLASLVAGDLLAGRDRSGGRRTCAAVTSVAATWWPTWRPRRRFDPRLETRLSCLPLPSAKSPQPAPMVEASAAAAGVPRREHAPGLAVGERGGGCRCGDRRRLLRRIAADHSNHDRSPGHAACGRRPHRGPAARW